MAKNSKIPGWPDMLQPPFANLAAGFGQGATNSATPPGFAGGMDFMKSLWGGLPSSVPGFVLPTLDIGELDKKIEDLRSVESWLALNANMLKATIQGLEVQRNTLAALQALRGKGDFLSAMMRPAATGTAIGQPSAAEADSANLPASAGQNTSKAAFAEAFRHSFGAGAGNPNWPLPLEPSEAAEAEGEEPPPYVEPAKVKKSERKKPHKVRAKQFAMPVTRGDTSTSAAQSANMWMNFLKDQFSQIASAALVAPVTGNAKVSASSAKRVARSPAKTAAGAATRPPAKPAAGGRAGPAAKSATRRRAPVTKR